MKIVSPLNGREVLGMSVIHRTTLKPNKLELLTAWLPSRPWYVAEPVQGRRLPAG
ncbi:hypothetical protein [Thermostaphylospora chromogena]|uniref:hypothetical protein n=1 Tax=Thermostaphylospora chromogena TaxID=35622 RepID=UPI000A7BFD3A|nr:hypothetical protein [Thermostaphylospora chromogena]